MKKILSFFGAIFTSFLFFAHQSLAFNEVCNNQNPCCTPPRAIVEGGGCPTGEYWIGDPITGSCETPAACIAGEVFQCATNTCDTTGNTCSATEIELNTCCAAGDVAEYDGTNWVCTPNAGGGASPWSTDASGAYIANDQVGIGLATAASNFTLNVQATGLNAASTGAINADSSMLNGAGITADGDRAGGVFSGDNGVALEAVSGGQIRALSDATEGVGTVLGFLEATNASGDVQVGSSSDHNLSIQRNNIPFIDLVVSGLSEYVHLPTGTQGFSTIAETGYLLIGDINARHLVLDTGNILAKVDGTTATNLALNTGDTGNVVVNMAHNSYASTVCRSGEVLGYCASLSSLKKNIQDLPLGLSQVMQLKPRVFYWKDGAVNQGQDLGFIAEEVEAVNPLLAEYDEEGQLRSVKYRQMTALLTQAIQEQQAMIESQQKEIDQLKALVCLDHPKAEVCK